MVFPQSIVQAAPSLQGQDPVAQCAEGWRLYLAGQYQEALPFLEAGYGNRDQATFSNPEDLGRCAMALGILYQTFGQPAQALEVETVALKIFENNHIPKGQATTLGEMGRAYYNLSQYDKALDHYQRSIDAWREVGNRQNEGRILQSMSQVYGDQGQYAHALDLLHQALAISREVGDRPAEGTTLGDIGVVYNSQGEYPEAIDILEQALEIQRELEFVSGEGIILGNLGVAYEALEQYAEALEHYQQALAISQALGDRQNEAILLSNIGYVYDQQGQPEAALEYYRQALTIQQAIGDLAGIGTTLNNIGGVYHALGQYNEAMKHFEQALAIAQDIRAREGEAKTLTNIGMLYQSQGLPDKALMMLEQAMDVFDTLRAGAGNDLARTSYIAQYSNPYDVAIALYFQQGQKEMAFFTSERARARAFLDSLTTGQVRFSNEQDALLYAREQELYSALLAAQAALAAAKSHNPPDESLVRQREAEAAQAQKEHQEVLEQIQARHSSLSELTPGTANVLSDAQIRALLDRDTTLLSFWIIEDSILVFILTQDKLEATAITIDPSDLHAMIDDFRSFGALDAPHPDGAVALYQALIDPLEGLIENSRLIIVPQGDLHYLPFAALTDGQRYLMDDYLITYLPSASSLPFIRENAVETGGQALILGNPNPGDYSSSPFPDPGYQLSPLHFAEEEAKEIGRELGIPVYVTTDATETLVRQQAPQAKILHLAAHGVFNSDSPLDSLIALSSDNQNDGWLTAGEVYGLDLRNSSLVVLSACETQIGQLTAGDEFIGLTRAFFFAGTPTVVASLWKVDDQSTALLMERFYTYIQKGMRKEEALRQAQIDVRQVYPNPYYWAAFVLNGDGEAVSGTRQTGILVGVAGLTLIVLLFAFIWFSRRRVSKSTLADINVNLGRLKMM
jgi:CHAT domain-containing protein/tetratricopeptide (TPR) repeat protein